MCCWASITSDNGDADNQSDHEHQATVDFVGFDGNLLHRWAIKAYLSSSWVNGESLVGKAHDIKTVFTIEHFIKYIHTDLIQIHWIRIKKYDNSCTAQTISTPHWKQGTRRWFVVEKIACAFFRYWTSDDWWKWQDVKKIGNIRILASFPLIVLIILKKILKKTNKS